MTSSTTITESKIVGVPMSPIVLIVFAIFLFVLFIDVFSTPKRKKDAFAAKYALPPVRVLIHGKVSEMSMTDEGHPKYSYLIMASRKKKNGRWGRAEEFSINRLDYAQMRENTEVDLFFDRDKAYAAFRLVKTDSADPQKVSR
ncbi:MAG: hypothetical protein AAFZ17_14395 [Cyanobacteria bacterium J06650_10]